MPATNAQLWLGGEVLRKQVRQAWNVLCIFFAETAQGPRKASPGSGARIPIAAMSISCHSVARDGGSAQAVIPKR
jgi:hypothetical protein